MELKSSSEKRFALLIDADNVSAKYLKPILDELSKYGTVTYKRIYGDWTLTLHAKWKDALLKASITPIQQFGYTQGKNATDSAMIIDAMDILYTNNVDGFCIVSSDSDFTRLASRLRESGVMVIGMGEKKTPVPFRTACDVFTTLELLVGERGSRRRNGKGQSPAIDDPTATREQIQQAVVEIITDNQNNGKATGLGEIGSRLQKRYPDFDVRNYGTNLLSKLLNEFEGVEIRKDGSNVVVELTDASLHDDSDEEAEKPLEQGAAEAGEDAEATSEGEAAPEKPRARRRSRGRRGRKASNAEAESEQEPADQAAEEAEPSPAPSDAVEQEAAKDQPQNEADAEEEPAPKPSSRRRPRSRSRSKAKPAENAEAAPEEAVVAADGSNAAEPEAKPATEPMAAASAEDAASQEPDDDQVKAFILELIAQAGEEGAAVGQLGKRVRGKFRTFRLRDRGFQNLRAYLATIDGVTIVKSGREHFAHLS